MEAVFPCVECGKFYPNNCYYNYQTDHYTCYEHKEDTSQPLQCYFCNELISADDLIHAIDNGFYCLPCFYKVTYGETIPK